MELLLDSLSLSVFIALLVSSITTFYIVYRLQKRRVSFIKYEVEASRVEYFIFTSIPVCIYVREASYDNTDLLNNNINSLGCCMEGNVVSSFIDKFRVCSHL